MVASEASLATSDSARTKQSRSREHLFHVSIALAILCIVFAGFSRSYYLRGLFGSPELDKFLHVHGFVMSSWIILLLIQVVLISAKRIEWHRRLGTVGISVATLVFAMGAAGTLRAAAREVAAHSGASNDQLVILALELTQVLLFGSFFSAGIWYKNQPAVHKRLMILATLCILPNPIVRIFLNFHVDSNFVFLLIWTAVVSLVVIADALVNRQLHTRFAVCACLAAASLFAAYYVGQSQAWLQWSAQLVS